MLFYKASMGKHFTDATDVLVNSYGGTNKTSIWMIGAGPSVRSINAQPITSSPAPKFCVNFAGRGDDGTKPIIEPTFFTAFDPVARFSPSMYLNPNIMKFINGGRYRDLIPGTDQKICDAPNTYFIDIESRGYHDFLLPGSNKILHTLDSFTQSIDIAFRLGFRKMYCVGTELKIAPSAAQIELAVSKGVEYKEGCVKRIDRKSNEETDVWSDRLADFLAQCVDKGVGRVQVVQSCCCNGRALLENGPILETGEKEHVSQWRGACLMHDRVEVE